MDRLNACKGKFIRMGSGKYSSYTEGEFFIPSDAVFNFTNNVLTVNKCQKVNSYPKTPAETTTTYPVSTNPNAYQEGSDAKPAGYVLGSLKTGTFHMANFRYSAPMGYIYSDSIVVNDSGVIDFVSPSTFDNDVRDYSANEFKNMFAGKFIQMTRTNSGYTGGAGWLWESTSTPSTVIYIPKDAMFAIKDAIMTIDRYQPVTGYAAIPAGTTIEYLGKLGNKARVQVLSYVGTGTYGSSNPNSLTFGNLPEAIIFLGKVDRSGSVYKNIYTQEETSVLYPKIIPNGRNDVYGYGFGYSIYGKRDGNTISWYSTKNQDSQANSIGHTFYYIVLS